MRSGDSAGLCGFVVIDKPAGLTSHGCVAAARRAYGLRRVGHGGTLDPAVTGVLPLALGPATRLLPYLQGTKAYRGVVQLGVRSSSDDLEGDVLERCDPPAISSDAIDAALEPFRGPIQQIPPQVSAVHVQGERAYAKARRGEVVALAARPVTIERLELLDWDPGSGRLELLVRCSAGTYIRSLARDLGESLGCGGALASLRRSEALGFDLSAAVSLEQLGEAPPPPLDPLTALGHLARHQLSAAELLDWRCGRRFHPLTVSEPPSPQAPAIHPGEAAAPPPDTTTATAAEAAGNGAAAEVAAAVAVIAPDGQLAGIARRTPCGALQPRLVFDAAG